MHKRDDKYGAASLWGRFQQHLQFFVLRYLIRISPSDARAATREYVTLGDLPSQELAFCRGTILKEAEELSLPPIPFLLPVRRIGRFAILSFLEFDLHNSEMLQPSQFSDWDAIGL